MKKLIALLLALMMVMVSVAALATGEIGDEDPKEPEEEQLVGNADKVPDIGKDQMQNPQGLPTPENVTFDLIKNYTFAGQATKTDNPADVLKFTVSAVTISDSSDNTRTGYAVTIPNVTVDPDSDKATITVKLPSYDLPGIYSYTITEDDTNIAGVEYLKDTLYLKVTVITNETTGNLQIAGVAVHQKTENGDKIDQFTNTYTAGSLEVNKTVTGNAGDYTRDFTFTVKFTAGTTGTEQDKVNEVITATFTGRNNNTQTTAVTNVVIDDWSNGVATKTFTLKHGDKVTFTNIPKNVAYEVTETADSLYNTTKSGDTGTINDAKETAAFTNTKNIDVDTGITLETLPYVLLMALAAMGFVALKLRKREEY